jgi:hypothetical protein
MRGALCVGIVVVVMLLAIGGFAQPPPLPPPGDPPPEQVCPCWDVDGATWVLEDAGVAGNGIGSWTWDVAHVDASASATANPGQGTVSSAATVTARGTIPVEKLHEECPEAIVQAAALGGFGWGMRAYVDQASPNGMASTQAKAQSHLVTSVGPNDYVDNGSTPPEFDQTGPGCQEVPSGGPPAIVGSLWTLSVPSATFAEEGTVKLYLFVVSYATAYVPQGDLGYAEAKALTGNQADGFTATGGG